MLIHPKLRKYPLTDERLKQVGESYRIMYALMAMAELEYTKYMDTNFKDPMIHKTISNVKDGIGKILRHHKVAVDTSDETTILGFVDDSLEVVKLMLNKLQPEQIREFAQGFSDMVREGEKAA